ncbi:hypothetical protein DL767_008434 [Monosporascus sp. MG133]|nr:hypothetical protein DL767_008434 [Monosporascus sp. MG133]
MTRTVPLSQKRELRRLKGQTNAQSARQSQRRIPGQPSLQGSAWKRSPVKSAAAKFEEWPLGNAVLKRILVDGVATFQLEFSLNACANHGQRDRAPESLRRKLLAEGTSSTGRALPSRIAFAPEGNEFLEQLKEGKDQLPWKQIQDGEFEVEEILDSRR